MPNAKSKSRPTEEKKKTTTVPASRRPTVVKGGQYVGQGTYGCVFSPPVSCLGEARQASPNYASKSNAKTDPASKSNKRGRGQSNGQGNHTQTSLTEVGKVFASRAEFDQELRIMRQVPAAFSSFTVPVKRACRIMAPTAADLQGSKCKNVAAGQMQLVYPHAGTDLQKLMDARRRRLEAAATHTPTATATRSQSRSQGLSEAARVRWLVGMFKAFKRIVHGLEVMHQHGIVHNDIKPPNIMHKDGELRLIDWGLMQWRADVFADVPENRIKSAAYVYWPPEYRLSQRLPHLATGDTMAILSESFLKTQLRWNAAVLYDQLLHMDAADECAAFEAYLLHSGARWRSALTQAADGKADMWGLGVSMLMLIARSGVHLLHYEQIHNKVLNMIVFVRELLHPDPRLRPSVQQVVQGYNALCAKL